MEHFHGHLFKVGVLPNLLPMLLVLLHLVQYSLISTAAHGGLLDLLVMVIVHFVIILTVKLTLMIIRILRSVLVHPKGPMGSGLFQFHCCCPGWAQDLSSNSK